MPWSQLHSAARQGDISALACLVDCGQDLNAPDASGKTPLHQAARSGHVAAAAALLGQRADLCAVDSQCCTPLHAAVIAGHTGMVRLLLQEGANPNIANGRGQTPLHSAAFSRQLEVLEALVSHGAKVDAHNSFDQTPLDLIRDLEDEEAMDALQNSLGNQLCCIPQNNNPIISDPVLRKDGRVQSTYRLHRAARSGDASSIGKIILSGTSPDAKDRLGQSALHKLASCTDAAADALRSVESLRTHGADIASKDTSGDSPLHNAALHGNEDMATSLLSSGAPVNACNDRQQTPLHKAAERGHSSIVKHLLAARADAEARDRLGRTPLHRAQWMGHSAVEAIFMRGHSSKEGSSLKQEAPPLIGGELRWPLKTESGQLATSGVRTDWCDELARLIEAHNNTSHGCSKMLGTAEIRDSVTQHQNAAVSQALSRELQAASESELCLYLGDKRDTIRAHAAMAVGRSASEGKASATANSRATSLLQVLLRTDTSWKVRQESARTLGIIAAAATSSLLSHDIRQLLQNIKTFDANAAVEATCHEAMQNFYLSSSIPDLLKAVQDVDGTIRAYAVEALGERGSQRPRRLKWQILNPLENVLHCDTSWIVRSYVPQALVRCGVSDPLDVGLAAVTILRDFLTKQNVNVVLQHLSSNKEECQFGKHVKKACDDALDTLTIHITFHGWRKMLRESTIFAFPVPVEEM